MAAVRLERSAYRLGRCMVTRGPLRFALWLSAAVWLLSWLGIALEIYRWHHLTPSLHLNPPPQAPGMPPPRPGEFLVTVIASALLAPLVFAALAIAARVRKRRRREGGR